MEGEIGNFIKVWLLAICCAFYAYTLSRTKHICKGFPRLLFLIPIVFIYSFLPFSLCSINLGAPTFFYLSWLGNFKLILFALGLGPLSPSLPNEPLSPLHFVSIVLLPIKLRESSLYKTQKPPQELVALKEAPSGIGRKMRKLAIFLSATGLLLYKRTSLPEWFVHVLFFVHVSFGVEIVWAISAVLVQAVLGLELEPQFRQAYLSTSLQEFWGSRWNLMTSNVLRLTVYDPIRRVTSPMLGKIWGAVAGMIASFIVSGFMHELIFYHYTRVSPTWEVTRFFILHGFCTAAEVILKNSFFRGWQPNRAIAMVLNNCFVGFTGRRLFMPQLLRNKVDARLLDEYQIAIDFVKETVLSPFRCNRG